MWAARLGPKVGLPTMEPLGASMSWSRWLNSYPKMLETWLSWSWSLNFWKIIDARILTGIFHHFSIFFQLPQSILDPLALSFPLGCGTSCGKLLHQHCSEASCHHCPWWFTLTIRGQRHLGFKLIPEVAEFSGGLFQMGHMWGVKCHKMTDFSHAIHFWWPHPDGILGIQPGEARWGMVWYPYRGTKHSALDVHVPGSGAQHRWTIARCYWMLLLARQDDQVVGFFHGFSRPYAPVLFKCPSVRKTFDSFDSHVHVQRNADSACKN